MNKIHIATTAASREINYGTCAVCKQPCSPLTEYHTDCYVSYRDFIENDYVPMVRQLAEKDPAGVLFALDPVWRRDMCEGIILPGRDE